MRVIDFRFLRRRLQILICTRKPSIDKMTTEMFLFVFTTISLYHEVAPLKPNFCEYSEDVFEYVPKTVTIQQRKERKEKGGVLRLLNPKNLFAKEYENVTKTELVAEKRKRVYITCCRGFVKKDEECVSPAASSSSSVRPGTSTKESTTVNEPRAIATSEVSVTSQRTTSEVTSASTAIETAPPLAQDPPLLSQPTVEITTGTFAESPSAATLTSEVSVSSQRTTSEVTSTSTAIETAPPLAQDPPLPSQPTVEITTVSFAESPSDKYTPQEQVKINPNTEPHSSVSDFVSTEELAAVPAQTELPTANEAVRTMVTTTTTGRTSAGTEPQDAFTQETQSVTKMTSDKTISENPASIPIEGINPAMNTAVSENTKPDTTVDITTEAQLISENTVLQAGLNDSPSISETGPVIEQITSASTIPATAKGLTVPNEIEKESVNANIPINEETRAVETPTTEITRAGEEVATPISDDAITETNEGVGSGIGSVGDESGIIQQVEDLPDEMAAESKLRAEVQ